MLLVVFIMYACTAVYGATVILETFQQMAEVLGGINFSRSQTDQILDVIYSHLDQNPSETEGNGPQASGLFFSETLSWIIEMRQCVGTVSLTTNVRFALLDPLFHILFFDWKHRSSLGMR